MAPQGRTAICKPAIWKSGNASLWRQMIEVTKFANLVRFVLVAVHRLEITWMWAKVSCRVSWNPDQCRGWSQVRPWDFSNLAPRNLAGVKAKFVRSFTEYGMYVAPSLDSPIKGRSSVRHCYWTCKRCFCRKPWHASSCSAPRRSNGLVDQPGTVVTP